MHRLSRQVRFWIEPFGPGAAGGYNSYAGRPSGSGLGIYLSLWVHLCSDVNRQTGFVINVSEIDKCVRSEVVPLLAGLVGERFAAGRGVGFAELKDVLGRSLEKISNRFTGQKPAFLELELSPYRKISFSPGSDMLTFGEKFEFAAMHRLWNDSFSVEENFEAFGKCANRAGHGHNYILEVCVSRGACDADNWLKGFEETVLREFLSLVDHKNLNVDVPRFSGVNPTVENIASFAWDSLYGKFQNCELEKITVWENDRTYCTYTNK